MKQVLEQYASAVIAGILAIILLVVIVRGIYGNGIGISRVLGSVLQDSIGVTAIVESKAMEDYVQGTSIILQAKTVYMTVGQEMFISDFFEAKNSFGEILPIFFQEAWNLSWENINVETALGGRKIRFLKEGAYRMQIFTTDKNGKEHSWIVKVLVNER